MGARQHKRVNLRGSVLFKLTSPGRLARALCISPSTLNYLVANGDANYTVWSNTETGRTIEEPKPLLKRVQARVAMLLAQIETPEYLHSGIKGRSYVTNANQHTALGGGVKLDVRKFFPSARAAAVCHFFHDVMEYPMDVASRMTRLLTIDGHIPTGGNASCILSFWAYKPMFDEIAELAAASSCTFTLYVDDMTLSGRFATREMQRSARAIVGRYRLKAHKTKVFGPRQPRITTGVAVTVRGPELPNRRAAAIHALGDRLESSETDDQRLDLMPQYIGRLSEAAVIDDQWSRRKTSAVSLRQTIKRRKANSVNQPQPAVPTDQIA